MLIPQTHVRKIWPMFAGRIMAREKTFEIRREDRSTQKAPDPVAWYVGVFDGYTIKSYEKAKQIADLYGIEPRPLYDRLSEREA